LQAPDTHIIYLLDGTVDYTLDKDEVFIRSLAGQIDILYRQQTYTLLGYPRYIYYWSQNAEFARANEDKGDTRVREG
jgi:hypothetical protein